VNLLDAIPEGMLVGLDTAPWIYEVEAHPVFGPIVQPFFRDRLGAGKNPAGSSLLALGELLVQPLAVGRGDLANRYQAYFISAANWSVWEVSRDVVETAAALRAKYRLKMMDALHLASAVVNGAAFFLGNDDGLRKVTEVQVLVLKDYTAPVVP
jgi:hypothetical protein